MGLKETLRKAAGLLVELPPEEAAAPVSATAGELDDLLAELEGKTGGTTKTVEQIVRDTQGPDLEQISVAASGPPPVTPEGQIDFGKLYETAKLPPASFSAEQMLEMLTSLPSELPLDTKRQTVRVTMASLGKTLGATPETVVADASRKLAALHAYVEDLSTQTTEFATTTESEIAALQAQIEEKRKAIQSAKLKLGEVQRACDLESDRLDDILEFFSLDVAPSKYAPGAP
jgi:hypothetical protein